MSSTLTVLSRPFSAVCSSVTKSAKNNSFSRILTNNLNNGTLFTNASVLISSSNKFTKICGVFDATQKHDKDVLTNTNSITSTRSFSSTSNSLNNSTNSSGSEETAAGCSASSRKFYSSAMPSDVFAAIKEKDQLIFNLKSEVESFKKWKLDNGFDEDYEEEENAKNGTDSNSKNSNVNMSAAGVGGIFFFTYAAAASHMLFLDSVPGMAKVEDPAVVEERNEAKKKVSQMRKKLTSTGVKRKKDLKLGKTDFGALA